MSTTTPRWCMNMPMSTTSITTTIPAMTLRAGMSIRTGTNR